MKANKYIKKYGWSIAKKAVQECTYGYGIDLDDLKRLVQSHDLVFCWGTLEIAKTKVAKFENIGLHTQAEQLKQAIIDVESCL